jgi:hypothetical protein
MRILLILAFPLDAAGVERRRAKIPTGLLSPDTEVDLVPIIDAGKLLMDSYYNFALYEPFIIQKGSRPRNRGTTRSRSTRSLTSASTRCGPDSRSP